MEEKIRCKHCRKVVYILRDAAVRSTGVVSYCKECDAAREEKISGDYDNPRESVYTNLIQSIGKYWGKP